ncbi:MAG: acyl-ACP--UDP-N-acetylglucosamine O-acyltransferase [Candidatus Marinimicrobia bacterium]|nr:acyl-ACP--UDP-N-acetylglucosamine O-acyltransferase [Candidatus Neomarinimicrobiota bacterium]
MDLIHKSAVIHPDAKLHESVKVGPYAIIDGDVEIDEGTVIDGHVLIRDGARIGKNNRFFHSAVISEIPQDKKFYGEYAMTIIGDNNNIREFATIHRGTEDRDKTMIGNDCLIMAYVHIAHDVFVGNNVVISNATQVAGHADIEDFAIISGMVGVHQFVKIGSHSFIGGGYRVGQDVPPFIMASGDPLRYAGLNTVGLKRRGFSPDKFEALKSFYRILYRSKYNVSDAVRKLEETFEFTEETRIALDFIKRSKRGLI